MKRILLCFILSAVTAASLSSCGRGAKTSVIVAGSTSVQPYMEILAEEYMRLFPDYSVDVQGGGSSAGIRAVASGIAQIGMSSRTLSEDEDNAHWSAIIAKDGLAVIVHPENPVSNLSIEQIRDIYTGRITDWGEVGGEQGKEIFVISREAGSGTRGFFEDFVMNGERISNKAIIQSTNGTIRTLVSGNSRGNKQAIGFISLGLLDLPGQNPVTGLAIDGVEPTVKNLINDSYKLYRPFLIVTDKEQSQAVKHFIDFILSDDGQTILENRGLVRITKEAGGGG